MTSLLKTAFRVLQRVAATEPPPSWCSAGGVHVGFVDLKGRD